MFALLLAAFSPIWESPPPRNVLFDSAVHGLNLGLLAIGIVLTWLGVRGRQIWLATWSAGLIVVSLVYLGWIAVGGI